MMTQCFADNFKAMEEPKIASVFVYVFFFSNIVIKSLYIRLYGLTLSKDFVPKTNVSVLNIIVMYTWKKIIIQLSPVLKILFFKHSRGSSDLLKYIYSLGFYAQWGSAELAMPSLIKYPTKIGSL